MKALVTVIVKLCEGLLQALVTGVAAAAGIGLTDYEHLITEATSPRQHRQQLQQSMVPSPDKMVEVLMS